MLYYPLKFYPIFKDRIWGGKKLNTELGKPIPNNQVGESWEISGVKDEWSIISNGTLEGTNLSSIIESDPITLLGNNVFKKYGTEFPILVKFIDASDDLSIQLHPNDAIAKKRHNCKGKTEMWHVLQADEGAHLIIGFKKGITQAEFKNALKTSTLEDLLHIEKVKSGDTYFINSGLIHAIGKGVLLAEIQQTSDITYRVYDYDRVDKDGKKRVLHTDLAIDALNYNRTDDFKKIYSQEENKVNNMVNSAYFITRFLKLTASLKIELSLRDSFSIYICKSGEGSISNDYGETSFVKGSTILIPATSSFVNIKTNQAEFLEVYMP